MADDKKKVSGKWEWLYSDTTEQLWRAAIYGMTVGGIAVLEKLQVVHFENQLVTTLVGLLAGVAIDALKTWKKDNTNAKG